MFSRIKFGGLLLSSLLVFLTGCHPENNTESVVFVNVERVISESSLAEQEKAHLEAVSKVLRTGASGAEKNYAGMTPNEQKQARQSDEQLLNNQWIIEQRAARTSVISAVKQAAEKLREQKGCALVLSSTVILDADPDRDVSEELVKILTDVKVNFAALPQVTPKIRNSD